MKKKWEYYVTNKELVEHIDSQTGLGQMRWEVHMQEV